jgi:hypothetical protein
MKNTKSWGERRRGEREEERRGGERRAEQRKKRREEKRREEERKVLKHLGRSAPVRIKHYRRATEAQRLHGSRHNAGASEGHSCWPAR